MAKALPAIGSIIGSAIGTLVGGPIGAIIGATIGAALGAEAAKALIKPPPARGSVARVLIDPNAPTPYAMGEGLVGGALRHDTAYGPTIKKVPNPYRFMAIVYSLGPVQSISPRIDFEPVSSYYNGFLFTDRQLGATPEANALLPQWAGATGWSSAHKLSGLAAIGWSFLFDREGKRFASGIDPLAAYGRWVKVYDPRKDSTFPGGSGSHRLEVESTYEWSENPALHAGTYTYGRYQNGKRVFGIGMPANGIDWNVVAAWANVCDANDWTIFGVVFEPGDRWANLKDICYAGGGEPVPGGVITFKYSAPKVALDTITVDDLVTDDEMSVVAMQSYRDRLNTVIPRYVSADHNWELVNAGAVVNEAFLEDDGEEKRDVWPFNFVKDARQAAQLAAYRLFDSREISPITLVCKPRLRHYRPGECLHVEVPRLGLNHDCIILSRNIDPVTMKVTLELMTETPGKHDFCLGRTASPPPTPAIGQNAEERDDVSAATILNPDIVVFADVPVFVVETDEEGNATSLPEDRQLILSRDDDNITTSAAWSIVSATSGITASVGSATGLLSVTDATVSGTVVVRAIFGGVNYERAISVFVGGMDGISPISVSPASITLNFAANSVGIIEPSSGQLPRTVRLTVMQGNIDLSEDAGTNYTIAPGTTGMSLGLVGPNNRDVRISAISAVSGSANITISRGGQSITVPVSAARSNAGTSSRDREIAIGPFQSIPSSYDQAFSTDWEEFILPGNNFVELSIDVLSDQTSDNWFGKWQVSIRDNQGWGAAIDVAAEQQAIAGQEETFDEFGGILNEFVPSAINSLLSVSVGAASERRYRFLVRRGGSPAISIQSSVGLIRVN